MHVHNIRFDDLMKQGFIPNLGLLLQWLKLDKYKLGNWKVQFYALKYVALRSNDTNDIWDF